MASRPIERALISVYDKTGIVDFARALVTEFGIEIISTGGTAAHLKENGIPVTLVEDITGFPEMLDGRVKTLHPKIHAAILADRDNPEHMRQLAEQGIKPIDMVVVNLYPFEKTVADPNCTFEQAIEMIDIGGPCLLRAAAKNHKHVMLVTDDFGADLVLDTLRGVRAARSGSEAVDRMRKLESATDAFWISHFYDAYVFAWLEQRQEPRVDFRKTGLIRLAWPKVARYGENDHQTAAMYDKLSELSGCESGVASAWTPTRDTHPLDEREHRLSYNNYFDAHAALELCKELTRAGGSLPGSVCTFIKHTNPCGVGVAADHLEAYRRAYLGDANAAMGGILACNFRIDEQLATAVMDTYQRWGRESGAGGFFAEVWVALEFEAKAVEYIRSAKEWGKRVRLLEVRSMDDEPDSSEFEYRSITGGMLVQTRDLVGLNEDQWKVVTKRPPSESEISDLRLAWLVAKHTKSNAISICKDGMLIGNGAGQMSRVMSCRIATWLANENGHADKLRGAAAASDAFFPFADGPKLLMDAGVTAIIQPGGSKRDEEVIKACDERGVAMIFTGTRHFKH